MSEHTAQNAVSALLERRVGDIRRPPSRAMLRVMHYVEQNPGLAITRSACALGREIGLSDATVIRAVQSLGFQSMGDLRAALASALQSGGAPRSPAAPTGTPNNGASAVGQHPASSVPGSSVADAIDLALAAHHRAIETLESAQVRQELQAAITLLNQAERIAVFGVGPLAPLACYAALLLPRVGRESQVLDRTGSALADQLMDLRAGDCLLLLASEESRPELLAAIRQARRLRLPVAVVGGSLDPRLARHGDVIIPVQQCRLEQMSLHGPVLAALEALAFGLAAVDRPRAVAAVERLHALHAAISVAAKPGF